MMRLRIGSLHEAIEALAGDRAPAKVISLLAPDTAEVAMLPDLGRERHLRCFFDDIDDPRCPLGVPPTRDHVAEILAFAERFDPHEDVLVHCQAGISRSTAAALAVICRVEPEHTEQQALDRVLAVRAEAWPNRLMVRYADDLLGRDGRLVQAVSGLFADRLRSARLFPDPDGAGW